MLAIILTTVLARGTYVQQPWDQRSTYAFNKAKVHRSNGNRVGVRKWVNRGLEAWEEAEKIQRIDLDLAELMERKGLAEQLIKDRDAAIVKSEGAQTALDTIQKQIDVLTAQKKKLMDAIVGQAQKADTVAAQITANVTGQSMPTPEVPASAIPQEGSSADVASTAPAVVEAAPITPTESTPLATEAATQTPATVSELPAPVVVEPASITPAEPTPLATEAATQTPATVSELSVAAAPDTTPTNPVAAVERAAEQPAALDNAIAG